MVRHTLAFTFLASMLGAAFACSGTPGGPVQGTTVKDCKGTSQPTSQSVCHLTGDPGTGGSSSGGAGGAGGATSSSASTSAGTGGAGAGAGGEFGGGDYGPTNDGSAADDDDCKYHVTWTSTDVFENQDVTFTVVATSTADGTPVTGGKALIESFLSDVHPAPNEATKTVENPPGTYTIGPVQFDAPGTWTVRFHFFEQCTDISEESPHAHAAFFVEVP